MTTADIGIGKRNSGSATSGSTNTMKRADHRSSITILVLGDGTSVVSQYM
jgi:hypothetical protein